MVGAILQMLEMYAGQVIAIIAEVFTISMAIIHVVVV